MIKEHHLPIPDTKYFPDGDYIRYWRDQHSGLVYGQLYTRKSKPVSKRFRYYGDTP